MTYAPKIQGDFALNQIVVHLALLTRSIAGPGNQAIQYTACLFFRFWVLRMLVFQVSLLVAVVIDDLRHV